MLCVGLPRLLGQEPIQLRGYPIEMVLAEKIVTALERGSANTRWRDFGDVYLLTGRYSVQAAGARQALQAVAGYDGYDPRQSRDIPESIDALSNLDGGVRGLRIGIDEAFIYEDVDPDVAAVVRAAEQGYESAPHHGVVVRENDANLALDDRNHHGVRFVMRTLTRVPAPGRLSICHSPPIAPAR